MLSWDEGTFEMVFGGPLNVPREAKCFIHTITLEISESLRECAGLSSGISATENSVTGQAQPWRFPIPPASERGSEDAAFYHVPARFAESPPPYSEYASESIADDRMAPGQLQDALHGHLRTLTDMQVRRYTNASQHTHTR